MTNQELEAELAAARAEVARLTHALVDAQRARDEAKACFNRLAEAMTEALVRVRDRRTA